VKGEYRFPATHTLIARIFPAQYETIKLMELVLAHGISSLLEFIISSSVGVLR
jgi:hypothetical protein